MKKIYLLASGFLFSAILLLGCSKSDYGYDRDYWLSKERGEVVFSDNFCPYYVVETANGFTVIRNQSAFTPRVGSRLYGDLSRRGYRDFYNSFDGSISRGEVIEYWLTYGEAQYLINRLCY